MSILFCDVADKAVIQDVMLEALMERRKMAPHDEYLLIDALTDLELPESTAVNDMIIVAIAGIHTVGIGRRRHPSRRSES